MTQSPSTSKPETDDSPHCVTCGYNLHTLSPEANCPECGTPVKRSLRGQKLADANPQFVLSLVTGTRLVAIGIGLSFIVIWPPFQRQPPLLTLGGANLASPLAGVQFFVVLAFVASLIVLTTHEPWTQPKPFKRLRRYLLRAFALASFAIFLSATLVVASSVTSTSGNPWMPASTPTATPLQLAARWTLPAAELFSLILLALILKRTTARVTRTALRLGIAFLLLVLLAQQTLVWLETNSRSQTSGLVPVLSILILLAQGYLFIITVIAAEIIRLAARQSRY